MEPGSSKTILRFGVYEADPTTGELRKNGVRIRLQDQPFRVLIMLLERPGELVTREEIRKRLWPADTFVDFDHGLNTVVNKLRETLGDSAANPRFIETLARRGYRFLASVETVNSHGRDSTTAQNADGTRARGGNTEEITPAARSVAANATGTSLLTTLDEVPAVAHEWVRVLFFLIQVMYLCFYIATLAHVSQLEELLDVHFQHPEWIAVVAITTAVIGIPVRLYLMAAVSFDVRGLTRKFQTLFPFVFPLDELWALSPFLLFRHIGLGLALAASAALIYVPFSERTLLLMGERHASGKKG